MWMGEVETSHTNVRRFHNRRPAVKEGKRPAVTVAFVTELAHLEELEYTRIKILVIQD